MKDDFDGAEMAGNSIAALNLLALGALLDRPATGASTPTARSRYYARRLRRAADRDAADAGRDAARALDRRATS